jgi:hypothetical protein
MREDLAATYATRGPYQPINSHTKETKDLLIVQPRNLLYQVILSYFVVSQTAIELQGIRNMWPQTGKAQKDEAVFLCLDKLDGRQTCGVCSSP